MQIINDTDLTCYINMTAPDSVWVGCQRVNAAIKDVCLWGILYDDSGKETSRIAIPKAIGTPNELVMPSHFTYTFAKPMNWDGAITMRITSECLHS